MFLIRDEQSKDERIRSVERTAMLWVFFENLISSLETFFELLRLIVVKEIFEEGGFL